MLLYCVYVATDTTLGESALMTLAHTLYDWQCALKNFLISK